ncbi:hypothetical protein [Methylibium sp.]|uniref:hypothetical protein n=1 Tax=Methylibium sp. TaxID=2067992 RepID=UPI0018275D9F|nr:hypothetical protein [Methylibium sp.]MBA3590479.1 hypothetical protein [Methylibium sp.]
MQPGLRRFSRTIAGGKSDLVVSSTFDGFRITALTDSSSLSVQIDGSEIVSFAKGMAWQRSAGELPWTTLRIFNDGAADLTVSGYAYVGGELRDDRLIVDAASIIQVNQQNTEATANAQWDAVVATTTNQTIVAAALIPNGAIITQLTLCSEGGNNAFAQIQMNNICQLFCGNGEQTVLPYALKIASNDIVLRYIGRALTSISYKPL